MFIKLQKNIQLSGLLQTSIIAWMLKSNFFNASLLFWNIVAQTITLYSIYFCLMLLYNNLAIINLFTWKKNLQNRKINLRTKLLAKRNTKTFCTRNTRRDNVNHLHHRSSKSYCQLLLIYRLTYIDILTHHLQEICNLFA